MERRDFLASTSSAAAVALAAASGFAPAQAQTVVNAPGWNKAAFDTKSLGDAAKAMGATSPPVESKELLIQAPEIAENGNVVRVGAQSNIPNTTQISFVVEKNPSALAASFDFLDRVEKLVTGFGQRVNIGRLAHLDVGSHIGIGTRRNIKACGQCARVFFNRSEEHTSELQSL